MNEIGAVADLERVCVGNEAGRRLYAANAAGMEGFAQSKPLDEFANLRSALLRALRLLDAVKHCVAVRGVQAVEEPARRRLRIKSG
jgi:hypothetical protein